MHSRRLLVAVAAVALLAAGCSGGAGQQPTGSATQGTPSSPATHPAEPSPSPSPLRSPTRAEAACLGTPPRIEALHRSIERFTAAAHGTVPLRTVHQAAFRLAALRPAFLAAFRRNGPFEGGDTCLRRAAVANAFVGTSLGPSPEIRLAALWYATLIAFYPHSPFLGEAQEYVLVQGYVAPTPGSGLHRGD